MTQSNLAVGMWVMVNIPDKPELTGEGFILIGPVRRDGRDLFHVDMGDHDNWFPADWLCPASEAPRDST